MPTRLTREQLDHDLSIRDLTHRDEGAHAMQLVVERAAQALADRWGCTVRQYRGDKIVTIDDNYDNLGYDPADVTRDARYSRYVDDHRMLRSHSTAMIPAALRELAAQPDDDVLLVCPGIVYRRDTIDRLHSGTPHQLDLWRITRRRPPMNRADLDDMISALVRALLPTAVDRREPRIHPYTLHGLQVDIATADGWVEIAESGLAHPQVLARAGLDASCSGLALGMGLDRMLMLIKNVPDIRLLRSVAPAVAAQFNDLGPYRAVSSMPPVRRDLSVVVEADDLAEDLGDRVRAALGAEAACVQTVEILQETPCAVLPRPVLARLGARTDQKNVLVKVVLRHWDKTLSDHEANIMRDRIYAALHQGTVHQWATDPPE